MAVLWNPRNMPTLVIGRVARTLLKLGDVRMKDIGITSAQLSVLAALKNGERLTQAELARILGVEQPSMAQLLSRMERERLIRREPSPDDRRSSQILLTEHALGQLEPGREALRKLDAAACAGLSKEERLILVALLTRIAANVETAMTLELTARG